MKKDHKEKKQNELITMFSKNESKVTRHIL